MKNRVNTKTTSNYECSVSVEMFYMHLSLVTVIWDKVFKNGPSKICGRQTLKKIERIWSA